MNILVTGGAGYIGSHTCITLLELGHRVIIVDNLSNSNLSTIKKIKEITRKDVDFYLIDITIEKDLIDIFERHSIDGVIHFAGYKSIGESTKKPLQYYYNNVCSTINLAKLCLNYNVTRFIFSSSATVYGDNNSPFNETMKLLPSTNPYGETKVMGEKILLDIAKVNKNFKVSILRYFNPVGAHPSGLIGEEPNSIPNNLMPFICKVAKGEYEMLYISGSDYPTRDGTGVRDYIHVMDLAKGHVAALKNQKDYVGIYNLGTGQGTSVLELIKTFEKVNGVSIPYKFVERRQGDLAICYADVSKAYRELNWKNEYNISDMCRHTWRFVTGSPNIE